MSFRTPSCVLILSAFTALLVWASHAQGDSDTPEFALADGLAFDLVARDPQIQQPVYLTFDARGRMWVVQYLQFPFPAGLEVAGHDQYWRIQYANFPPPPPPHGTPGLDKVTILEDQDGDGTFEHAKDFVTGLNICTAALPGDGGVWVLNPPYLLFYPDANGDDVPDGEPEVHLEGFGLEDMHAVANSLRWGPDGMLYGCQGSTTTATIKRYGVDEPGRHFTGQCIWRYDTKAKKFEIYAEGGYNNFGIAIDNQGRMFTGTNGGLIGLHYVQGGYYWKSWGKHGPLTNPYAFGFFNAMEDESSRAKLSQAMIVYDDTVLPERYWGKLLVARVMQRRIDLCELRPKGSTFSAHEMDVIAGTEDERFRPVDMKLGPDGAVYVADWYDTNVTWNVSAEGDRTDRATGRIYRIRAADAPAEGMQPNLTVMETEALAALLQHPNRWMRETARRQLAVRDTPWPVPGLTQTLAESTGQDALENLWTAYACGGFTDSFARAQLTHPDPYVRLWTVRLLGEQETIADDTAAQLLDLATNETHPEVRSQLAATARRLGVARGLPVTDTMVRAGLETDRNDEHIPLLQWWSVDSYMREDPDAVLRWADAMLRDANAPLFAETILPRLAQRLAMEADFAGLVHLLGGVHDESAFNAALAGMAEGLPADVADRVSPDFADWLDAWLAERPEDTALLALAIRIARPAAEARALARLDDAATDDSERVVLIEALSRKRQADHLPRFLALLAPENSLRVREAALAALQNFGDDRVALAILAQSASLPGALRQRGFSILSSRAPWARMLLDAVEKGAIDSAAVSPDLVANLRRLDDDAISARATALWGLARSSPQELLAQLSAVRSVLLHGEGTAAAGRAIYMDTCSKCHVFHGEGRQVGPELTGVERDNQAYLLEAIIDPSSTVLPEYLGTVLTVEAEDEFGVGEQVLTGFILEDSDAGVRIVDSAGNVAEIPADKVKDRRPMELSIMPEGLLTGMSDTQLRDLFAYLQQDLP